MWVYIFRFKTLLYKIEWDNATLIFYFYKGLYDRVKNMIIAIKRSDSLKEIIKIEIRIDNR